MHIISTPSTSSAPPGLSVNSGPSAISSTVPSAAVYEVLYVSILAESAPISVVAQIAARSRFWNSQHGITGLLIFDGLRFCQQFEGPQELVLLLLDKIRADVRHSNMTVFHRGEVGMRRFKSFSMAFSTLVDVEALAELEKLSGAQGIQAFVNLLPTLDLQV